MFDDIDNRVRTAVLALEGTSSQFGEMRDWVATVTAALKQFADDDEAWTSVVSPYRLAAAEDRDARCVVRLLIEHAAHQTHREEAEAMNEHDDELT
jgi:hypothetical protein